MKDYHNLENEVLAIFRQINEDENNKEIGKLLDVFQKYWKSYQDNWPSRYWDIYNLVYDESCKNSDSEKNYKETHESSKINLKDNQFKVNNLDIESFISIGDFKNGIEQQNEIDNNNNMNPILINNESLLKNYCQQKKKKNKKYVNSKNKSINSLTNLDDIDKELDYVFDNSHKNSNEKNIKNRGCFDCNIF